MPLLLSGCFLPLVTSAPQSATTVGKGKAGLSMYTEFPSPNLTAGALRQTGDPVSPSLSGVAQVAYGLSERLDLELGVEGMFYLFVFPLPTGASAGARYQLLDGGAFDVAIAGRAGLSGYSWRGGGEPGTSSIRSQQAVLSISGQYARGWFRPGAAVSFIPVRMDYRIGDSSGSLGGLTSSATLNLALDFGVVELTPFLGAVLVTGLELPQSSLMPQAGLSLAFRGDKRAAPRKPPVSPPQTPQESPPPAPPAL